jgi:hypothetical protein
MTSALIATISPSRRTGAETARLTLELWISACHVVAVAACDRHAGLALPRSGRAESIPLDLECVPVALGEKSPRGHEHGLGRRDHATTF